MADFIGPLLEWLNAHPQLAGLVTFTISAAESVAIIGTIVPGSIMMTALGTLAGAGIIPLWETIFWAILGAIVGDGISYWVGRYFKEQLPLVWPFKNYPNLLASGEIFFHKYGGMSVFIGRFVGPVRALVPLVAGMLGMKPLNFTVANVTSAIGWAPAYMLPGILLGAASLELPPDIALHVILVLLLMFLFGLLCLWFAYKLLQLIHNQTNQLQDWIWRELKKSRYFSSITYLFKHYDPVQLHGQLTLLFYFMVTSAVFFSFVLYIKFHPPATILINDVIYHLFRGLTIRNSMLDNVMIDITLLGQKQIIFILIIIISLVWIYHHRKRAAIHLLFLGGMSAVAVYAIKQVLGATRPPGILQSPVTFSMPSGHATLATALYVGLAFFLTQKLGHVARRNGYALAIAIAVLVGISRLYLGMHWFTDVFCGWLLGSMVVMLIILSYRRQYEKAIPFISTLFITLTVLIVSIIVYNFSGLEQIKKDSAQIDPPALVLNVNDWWHAKTTLPADRASLFGFPSQRINIQWLGDLPEIKHTLIKEGWTNPPARDFISVLHRIADVSSSQYLPLVSPQYLDKTPRLILTKQINHSKNLIVIRMWDANFYIPSHQNKLWVGIVSGVPRSYSWLVKKNNADIQISPELIFINKKGTDPWQWKFLKQNNSTVLFIKPANANSKS